MAKAWKKHKRQEADQQFGPPREPLTFSLPEPTATRLRQLADQWRAQRAEAEQRAKDREVIDRYIAIRDNQIPPPWMDKPKQTPEPLKPKHWLQAQVKEHQGNIPKDITPFSRQLHAAALEAVRESQLTHAPAARTIENLLRDLGIFPKKKRR
jgi:hypothetical protein